MSLWHLSHDHDPLCLSYSQANTMQALLQTCEEKMGISLSTILVKGHSISAEGAGPPAFPMYHNSLLTDFKS